MIFQILGKNFFLTLLSFIPHISDTLECVLKNTTCTDIRVAEGFSFKHDCLEGSEIDVEGNNKTNLGHADLRTQHSNHLPPIVKIDNYSVITEKCQDLTVTCTTSTRDHNVLHEENCRKFKIITDDRDVALPHVQPWSREWIIALVIIALVIIAIFIVYLLISRYCWKKETRNQHHPTYFRYVMTCLCIRKRDQERNGFPMGGTRDLEEQNLGEISGEMGAPNTTTPSDHRAMNRNLMENPGGINGTKGRGIQRELDGGGAVAHHQAEEQQLLPDQRAASGSLDRPDEAVALVNELSFDRDRVSRCSATPDADVESTHPGKQINELS